MNPSICSKYLRNLSLASAALAGALIVSGCASPASTAPAPSAARPAAWLEFAGTQVTPSIGPVHLLKATSTIDAVLGDEFGIQYRPYRERVLQIINDIRKEEGKPPLAGH